MIPNIILLMSLHKHIAKLSGVAKMPSALFLQKIGSVLSLAFVGGEENVITERNCDL